MSEEDLIRIWEEAGMSDEPVHPDLVAQVTEIQRQADGAFTGERRLERLEEMVRTIIKDRAARVVEADIMLTRALGRGKTSAGNAEE